MMMMMMMTKTIFSSLIVLLCVRQGVRTINAAGGDVLLSEMFEGAPWEVSGRGCLLANRLPETNALLERSTSHQEPLNFELIIGATQKLLHRAATGNGSEALLAKIRYVKQQLEALLSLQQATLGCSYKDYVRLGCLQRALIDSGLESVQRTSLMSCVVMDALYRHSENCRGSYLPLYERHVRQWSAGDDNSNNGSEQRETLELVLDAKFMNDFFVLSTSRQSQSIHDNDDDKEDLIGSLKASDVFRRFRNSHKTLLMNLLTKALSGPQPKLPANPAGCRAMLEAGLAEPCEWFVRQTEAIFRPARLDLAIDESKVNEITGSRTDFEDDWKRFRICDVFVRNKTRVTYYICQAMRFL